MSQTSPDLVRALFAGTGWIAVLLVALFGGHGCTPAALEARLAGQVEQALAREGLDYVYVDMDGQTAILDGVAPSQEARDQAEKVALQAAGMGGPWAGGVSGTESRIEVGEAVQPYVWRAVRSADSVRLEGVVPSERLRRELIREGRRLFGAAQDRMILAAGAPGAGWGRMAAQALEHLAQLESGEARLTDGLLVLMGEAKPEIADAVRAAYRDQPPEPFRVLLDLTRPGEGSAIAALQDLNLNDAAPGACQTAFERLLDGQVILFDTASAKIDQASLVLLADLAAVARRCDRYSIEISGHTDGVGDRGRNMILSQERAQAVRDHLVQLGVAPERLSAVGFGPDRPVASNAGEAGRQANRRIEFQVVP